MSTQTGGSSSPQKRKYKPIYFRWLGKSKAKIGNKEKYVFAVNYRRLYFQTLLLLLGRLPNPMAYDKTYAGEIKKSIFKLTEDFDPEIPYSHLNLVLLTMKRMGMTKAEMVQVIEGVNMAKSAKDTGEVGAAVDVIAY